MTPSPQSTLYCAECGRPATADELARFGDLLICPYCKDRYAQKLREGVAPARAMVFGGFWIRFVAYLIDAIILGVAGSMLQLAFAGSFFTSMPLGQPGATPTPQALGRMLGMVGLLSLVNLAISGTYEGLFLGKLGATPGKMALGLKVVRADGSAITVGRAFGRYFAKILSSLILMIGFLIAGFDAEKRALHDMICDTRVIKARN